MGLNHKDTQFLLDAVEAKLAERYSRGIIDVLCRSGATTTDTAQEIRALSQKFTQRLNELDAAIQILNKQEAEGAAKNE